MGIRAKPHDFIEAKNEIYRKAIEYEYPEAITLSSRSYKVFSATSWRSSATGYYRAVVPFTVLRDGYRVLDAGTGFDLPDDAKVWASVINKSEVLILEREFQHELIPALYRYKESNGPIIYDIDDHIKGFRTIKKYHSYEEELINEFWAGDNSAFLQAVMNTADAIVATTIPLATLCGEAVKCPAYTIRNCVDTVASRWNFEHKKFTERDHIIIGYMGGATHGEDLDIFQYIFPEILSKYHNVKVKFIGYTPKWAFDLIENWTRKRILTDFGWSSLDNYPKKMYDIDIGLAPLANNEFNRIGKSDLKYLEYTMAGVCTVASKLGQYKEAIRHKQTGLLASNIDEWIHWLSYLVENPDKIQEIRDNAVADVITNRAALQTARDWYKTIVAVRKRWELRH